jgi:hypothetical protein
MKLRIMIMTALLATGFLSSAQGIRLGAKAGANVYKISGKSFSEQFQYGYHVGGFVRLKLGKKISVQPEVLFNQNNTTVDSNFKSLYSSLYNPSYIKDVKLKYLSIPLLLNYHLNKVMTLQAGPQFGVLIDNNKNLLQNGGDAFNKGDFSMLAGIQFNLGKLHLSGRYGVGLSNLNDIDNRDRWKSQTAQVSLGFAL